MKKRATMSNYRVVYRPTSGSVGRIEEIVCHTGGLEATVDDILSRGGSVLEVSEYKGEF